MRSVRDAVDGIGRHRARHRDRARGRRDAQRGHRSARRRHQLMRAPMADRAGVLSPARFAATGLPSDGGYRWSRITARMSSSPAAPAPWGPRWSARCAPPARCVTSPISSPAELAGLSASQRSRRAHHDRDRPRRRGGDPPLLCGPAAALGVDPSGRRVRDVAGRRDLGGRFRRSVPDERAVGVPVLGGGDPRDPRPQRTRTRAAPRAGASSMSRRGPASSRGSARAWSPMRPRRRRSRR